MSEENQRPEEEFEERSREEAGAETGAENAPGQENPEDAQPEAPEAAPAGDDLEQQLERERSRAERNWEEFLRARAELDNLRKRSSRDLEHAHKFALEAFVKDLLPVKDSLEQGLQAAREEGSADKLVEGKELTLRMLSKVLADHGVEEVDPEGRKFDPELHEAMTMQPSEEHDPETVMMVLQKGYVLNGRLVRPARVVVAKAPDGS